MAGAARGRSQQLSEHAARRVLLVEAFETGREARQWSVDDRHWATRLARETWAGAELPAQALALRAEHALQRLTPRHPAIAQALQVRLWRWRWTAAAALLGLVAGVLIDAIGSGQQINLLAPPVWAVVAWNLAVYGLLLVALVLPVGQRQRLSPRRLLAAWVPRVADTRGPLGAFAQKWSALVAPVALKRVAMTLHLAAAALALGLVVSLYVRGLVLDYRAGWQSTFLEPPVVQEVLDGALGPASRLTRIKVPDVVPLRVNSIEPAKGPAAPWLHLYAATLLLAVVLPRLLLGAAAGVAAWRAERTLPLPLHEPYYQQLLRELKGRGEVVWVLPHGSAPGGDAAQGVRQWLAAALGQDTHVQIAPPVGDGQELALPQPRAAPTMVVLLVDLVTTPESETHGQLLTAITAAWPDAFHLVLADSSEFNRRHGHLPERGKERRALWRGVAARRRCGFVAVDLMKPDLDGAVEALQAAADRLSQHASGALHTTGAQPA